MSHSFPSPIAALLVLTAGASLNDWASGEVLSAIQEQSGWSQKSLLNAPSLHLRVDLFGNNMGIHDQSSFDVFANPVVSTDGTGVRYDGFAHFIQEETQFTYLLVDGATYVVTSAGNSRTSVASPNVRCHSSAIPFASILPALNNARATPSAVIWGEPVDCPSGSLYQTSFGEDNLVLCASSEYELKILGETIMITVSYLDSPARTISAPTLSDTSTLCDSMDMTTSVTPIGITLLTGKPTRSNTTRNLNLVIEE